MDPEVSLKLSKRADETIFGKAITGVGRAFYSSTFSIYTLIISTHRSNLMKAYKNYTEVFSYKDEKKREQITEKYQKAYKSYIDSIDKYITEGIYTKMQKQAATVEEQHIMSDYYAINKYKGVDQVEHKTRFQILALNMDWNYVQAVKSHVFLEKYKDFYLTKIQELYKDLMRHEAIILANAKIGERDQYEAIYKLIETYIKDVLTILPESEINNQIIKDYHKFAAKVDEYEGRQHLKLQKRIDLLSFGRELFEYSFPVVAVEQCYKETIDVGRTILSNCFLEQDKFAAYQVLQNAVQDYFENGLANKTYWVHEAEKIEFQKLNEEWQTMQKLGRIDFDSYSHKREVFLIRFDISEMKKQKLSIPEVADYYRERLIVLHALRRLHNKPGLTNHRVKPARRLKADDFCNQIVEFPNVDTSQNYDSNTIEKFDSINTFDGLNTSTSNENITGIESTNSLNISANYESESEIELSKVKSFALSNFAKNKTSLKIHTYKLITKSYKKRA